MKNSNLSYESPVLSLVTVCPEQGFATSSGDGSDVDGMLNGYGIEDVNW